MSIVYALVARGNTVLVESTTATGNFEILARELLRALSQQVPTSSSASTATREAGGASSETAPLKPATSSAAPQLLKVEPGSEHTVYVSRTAIPSAVAGAGDEEAGHAAEQLVMLCLCEAATPARVAFAFLAEARDKFTRTYEAVEYERAIAYSFNAEFSAALGAQMQRFNGDGAHDERVRRVREQLDDLKDVMVRNIDSLLNRGEALDILVEKTDRMQQAAFKFEKASERTANLMWWKKVRCRVGAALFALLVLFLLLVVGCGGFDFASCGG